uniref:Reverse transcriptase domain-containing protein n=1 Tax=Dendroctonus ponderosae TaxID=77166 RepID=A0AAR5PMZ0_DENPD
MTGDEPTTKRWISEKLTTYWEEAQQLPKAKPHADPRHPVPIPSPNEPTKEIINVGSEDMLEISPSEIKYTLQQMKNGKSPEEDRITQEMLKLSGKTPGTMTTKVDSYQPNIYDKATFHVQIDDDLTDRISLGKGVRQGDTISPKLFPQHQKIYVFKKLEWKNKGLKMDGVYRNHLRFADEIVLMNSNIQALNNMVDELNEQSKKTALKIFLNKYKIMIKNECNITIDHVPIGNVEHYI